MMRKILKNIFMLGFKTEDLLAVKNDILEDNRRCAVVYSSIVIGGMGLLLFLSLFVDVLASSRKSYLLAILVGIIVLIVAIGPAKKIKGFSVTCEYILAISLLTFGIILGTVVEPNQASASYAVLLFVVPLLFTDLPYRINTVTIISIIVYILVAKQTQSKEMFAFNMSVIMPYGITNLILTHYTLKSKIAKFIYSHQKQIMAENDRLTGFLNRWSFEEDVKFIKNEKDIRIIGVCSFDTNNLKNTNDTYGHKAGDELLIASANAIKKVFGKYGNCYRVGGDEFMAIIDDNYPSKSELARMLEVETSKYHSSYGFGLSVAVGIAEGENKKIEELSTEADRLMYMMKQQQHATSDFSN